MKLDTIKKGGRKYRFIAEAQISLVDEGFTVPVGYQLLESDDRDIHVLADSKGKQFTWSKGNTAKFISTQIAQWLLNNVIIEA